MSQEAENKIVVKNLSKTFDMYNSPMDKLKEALSPRGKIRHTEFHALTDLSFNVKKGEILGIMGRNGAGKSTLLKIITGILEPTSGSVEVSGRISSLLELGTGFNMEYTGIENIYFYGTLMGFTKKQMDKKLDDIIKFAEIGDYIDQVVKTYSSGMFARLAFSCAINVEPEILIVDEILSVGDMRFQAKCFNKFKEFLFSFNEEIPDELKNDITKDLLNLTDIFEEYEIKDYLPDFYLDDYNIYIEHFGLNRNCENHLIGG